MVNQTVSELDAVKLIVILLDCDCPRRFDIELFLTSN